MQRDQHSRGTLTRTRTNRTLVNARLVTARANRVAAILRDAKGKMRKRRVLTDEKRGERVARDTRSLAIASRGRSRLRSVTNSGRPAPNAPFRLRRHSLVHLRAASFLPVSLLSANILELFGSARRRLAKAAEFKARAKRHALLEFYRRKNAIFYVLYLILNLMFSQCKIIYFNVRSIVYVTRPLLQN